MPDRIVRPLKDTQAHPFEGKTAVWWRVANPWLDRRVLHYAHQGGAREAPSSTLHALRRSDKIGAHALELDVHRTVDGHLVVCHDSTVDRTTPTSGAIAAMTLADVRSLDNAYWWVDGHESLVGAPTEHYEFRGHFPDNEAFGIATLEEVLNEFSHLFINLDIKETAPNGQGYERQLADILRAYGRTDDVIVASFHDSALAEFRTYAPEIHTALGPADTVTLIGAFIEGATEPALSNLLPSQVAVQVPYFFGELQVVSPTVVERVHETGLAVHVWTIDEHDEMHQLLDMGVDGIMTDCPSVLASVLNDRQMNWSKPRP